MKIANVRFMQHIPLGKEVVPDNFLERGRNLASSRCIDLEMYDSMFLKVTLQSGSSTYAQFIPWAQVATVIFDDAPAAKSKGGKGSAE